MEERGTWVVAGKGELAVYVAKSLHSLGLLVGVVPSRPRTPGLPDLQDWAEEMGVHCSHDGGLVNLQPADFLISVFYNKILRQSEISAYVNCFNIHNSPLPFYRGVRSINWALKNGERRHGITLHKIDQGVDTGDICGQVTYSIWPELEEVEDVYARANSYGKILWEDFIRVFPAVVQYASKASGKGSYFDSSMNHLLGDRYGLRRS